MSEILDEYEEKKVINKHKSILIFKLFFLAILVILFGIYIGDMLFGKSSLDVLLNLQADKNQLEKRVHVLKEQNARLQKEYFELQQLDPDIKEFK